MHGCRTIKGPTESQRVSGQVSSSGKTLATSSAVVQYQSCVASIRDTALDPVETVLQSHELLTKCSVVALMSGSMHCIEHTTAMHKQQQQPQLPSSTRPPHYHNAPPPSAFHRLTPSIITIHSRLLPTRLEQYDSDPFMQEGMHNHPSVLWQLLHILPPMLLHSQGQRPLDPSVLLLNLPECLDAMPL